jgi:hypothetical protein
VGATAIHSNVQQVSTKTLKPVKRINFMLKNTVPMGENLTFDKHGNAYFYTTPTAAGHLKAPSRSTRERFTVSP